MNKWEKIPCTLQWTLNQIDLHSEMDSEFQFSWSRGDSKGESDVMKPKGTKLVFNSNYEVPCTMYISKADGSIRPKKLKVMLRRFVEGSKSKIYGKLSIDVAAFYGKTVISKYAKDMESGRGTAPTFEATFLLYSKGELTDAQGSDMNDMSFLGEPENKVPLKDWDVQEVGSDNEDSEDEDKKSKKHKKHKKKKDDKKHKKDEKKHKKKKKKDESKSETSSTSETPTTLVFKKESHGESAQSDTADDETKSKRKKKHSNTEDESEKKHRKHKKHRKDSADVAQESDGAPRDNGEGEAKVNATDVPREKKPAVVPDALKAFLDPKQAKEMMTQKIKEQAEKEKQRLIDEANAAESGKAQEEEDESNSEEEDAQVLMAAKEARLQDEEMMTASPEYFFHVILTHEWPRIKKPSILNENDTHGKNKIECSSQLFAVIAMLYETKFLEDNPISDPHFDSCLSVFLAEYPEIPSLTLNKKVLYSILLYLFVYSNPENKFSKDKVTHFLEGLLNVLEAQLNRYVQRFVNKTEVIVNRFATANFEFDHLLADFREIIQGTQQKLSNFGSSAIGRFMNQRFLEMFQYKVINKLISNPTRFDFTNSMIWSSLLSAVENDERISLSKLKQVVSGLNMAPNIALAPDLCDDVCPDMPHDLIGYIICNYHKDQNITEDLNPINFLTTYKLKKRSSYGEVKIQPLKFDNDLIESLTDGLSLQNWNKINKSEPAANHYTFYQKYPQ